MPQKRKRGRPQIYESAEAKAQADVARKRERRRQARRVRLDHDFNAFYNVTPPPSAPKPLEIVTEDPASLMRNESRAHSAVTPVSKRRRTEERNNRDQGDQSLAAIQQRKRQLLEEVATLEKREQELLQKNDAVVRREGTRRLPWRANEQTRSNRADDIQEVDHSMLSGILSSTPEKDISGDKCQNPREGENAVCRTTNVEKETETGNSDHGSLDWTPDSEEEAIIEMAMKAATSPCVGQAEKTSGSRETQGLGRVDLTQVSLGEKKLVMQAKCAQLCEEQLALVKMVLDGKNVFYTGGAGTGKSTVLKAMVEALRMLDVAVEVVAPTGISAINVGGCTYFSWAGWSPMIMKESLKNVRELGYIQQRRARIEATQVLIIDEISMIEANQFERLDQMCRTAKSRPNVAFGGMQVVVTGDFCQLAPVKAFQTCLECGVESVVKSVCAACEKASGSPEVGRRYCQDPPLACSRCRQPFAAYACPGCHARYALRDQWAFRARAWQASRFEHVALRRTHRQSDPAFIHLLNTLRVGRRLDATQLGLLCDRDLGPQLAIELSPVRQEVEQKNLAGYEALAGAEQEYSCTDYVHIQKHHEHLRSLARPEADGTLVGCRDHRFSSRLRTKCGMPVLLVANMDTAMGLVNGTQGRIMEFVSCRSALAARRHELDVGSRFRGLAEEQIEKWVGSQGEPESLMLPRVQFENGLVRTMFPVCQDTELGDPRPFSVIARTQIPLLPAWAITIHKSQGMTLSRAIVNLDHVFERQMAYVAMSRVRSLGGLKVVSRIGAAALQEKGRLGGRNMEVQQFMQEQLGDGQG